jgi:hypothetical protein
MNEPRQKSIALTPKEKEKLDREKELYEQNIGRRVDWGEFLGVVAVIGLAALGIHEMVRSSRGNPTTICPVCKQQITIAYSGDLPEVFHVVCPQCKTELVVDFRVS